jgi:hypothetical protein
MSDVRPGDLAVVVAGLGPNIGRIIYVSYAVQDRDFKPLGFTTRTGWRIRSCSKAPLLLYTGHHANACLTPTGSLRPLDRLPEKLQAELDAQMALSDLADYFAEHEECLAEEDALETQITVEDR